jgi:N-acetylglucosamine malate deacetylase 1
MKLDILVFAAHPDDAELGCSGTILSEISKGKKVGIVDLTRGELGTRGTPEIRKEESDAATKIMGLHARENLGFRDGFFRNDESHQLKIVEMIRKYQPEIVLANAVEDRHPDHGKGASVVLDACFISGLRMVETQNDGKIQKEWRPKFVYQYIQDRYIKPDFVVDVSDFWDLKEAAIRAFKSQFFDPNSSEPKSYISDPKFLKFIEARSREMGHSIGVKYGEGFTKTRMLGIKSLTDLQ